MQYRFTDEPGKKVTVQMKKFVLDFDENGELLMSEDHPALERMKNAFPGFEVIGLEEGKKIKKCKQCDFETDNQGVLLAHIRKEHPKGVN